MTQVKHARDEKIRKQIHKQTHEQISRIEKSLKFAKRHASDLDDEQIELLFSIAQRFELYFDVD